MALYQPMPLPEPMNASPHHSKVKVALTLADPVFVAGDYVAGKLELECRADKGLGVGVILVELFAIQELHSRDHSATSTFIHSKRVFQGPGLPPSNAVQAHPQPGFPALPPSYYQARRGLSTFLFRIPIPETSPSSLIFGSGVARVRYELRASVGVVWKGDRRLVIDNQTLDVVSSFPHELIGVKEPEAITIGENGKLWMQGNLVGPLIVAGESACIQLQVKNHSNKKNTGLSVSLNRTLVLPGVIPTGKQAMELADTLTHVPFRGTEYIIPPGAEGVAHLVFDVPRQARAVRGGVLDGDEVDPPRSTESLFEVRCTVEVKMTMGLGNKDLVLTIPVPIVHPRSVPPGVFAPPQPAPVASPYPPYAAGYGYPVPPVSPPIPPFMVDHQHNQIWLPPPTSPMPIHPHMPYPPHPHRYLMSPAPHASLVPAGLYGPQIARPTSAGGNVSIPDPFMLPRSGLPATAMHNIPAIGLPMPSSPSAAGDTSVEMDAEEGKGQRALRVSRHLRMSSRTRSVSPQSHRFPVGAPLDQSTPLRPPTVGNRQLPQPPTAPVPAPLNGTDNASLSPTQVYANTMVHSPRPQLTPKHSFYNERPKSESVEVLERMANVVDAQLRDLSGDIPKDEELQPSSKSPQAEVAASEAEINKTLPAPPVPSSKVPLAPLVRPPLDRIFEDSASTSTPILAPSSKAPPTPTLTAILPKRYPRSKIDDFLSPQKTESSGLDALEKRLLAEVGTRKFDDLNPHKSQNGSKVDVRETMGVTPIAIPVKTKSDDALNDSAISSLTLANDHKSEDGDRRNEVNDNDYNGDDDDRADTDMEVEAKTHRGAGSGDERGRDEIRDALNDLGDAFLSVKPRHREEADSVPAGSTPTKLSAGSGKSKGDKRSSGRKKDRGTKEDRVKAKTEAKGRVAAWLGGVVAEPPQEESIPPSPSSARRPESALLEGPAKAPPVKEEEEEKDVSTVKSPPQGFPKQTTPLPSPKNESASDEKGTSAPNPRSSGFLPLHTFKRGTLPRNMVVEESRKVTDIWSAELASRSPPAPIAVSPRIAAGIPFRPTPQSVRTDRRVSPPSRGENILLNARPPKPETKPASKPVDKSNWAPPPFSRTKTTSPPPVPPPKPDAIRGFKPTTQQPKFPPLPERKQDPEVSYDVRSARGGRGGKVTSVAALWASMTNNGAAGSEPPIIKPKPTIPEKPARSQTGPNVPASKPQLVGKVALPGLAKPEVARSRSKSPLIPSIHVPTTHGAPPSSRPAPGRSNTSDDIASKQPKKLSSAINLAQLGRAPAPPSRSKSTDAHSSTATTVPFSAYLKAKSSGTSTPTNNNQRPTSSAGSKGAEAVTAFQLSAASGAAAGASTTGAARTQASRPMIKSTSVPAMISSSHAVPVLSSTASLARPPPSAPGTAAELVNGRRQQQIGISRSAAKAVVDRPVVPPILAKMGALGSALEPVAPASSVPVTKSPPPDLAFGQARLRDLIKKYQT